MIKQVAILLCVVLILTNANVRDLVDEAEEQLNELESIVQGATLVGRDNLNDLVVAWGQNSANVQNEAYIAILQEGETITARVTSIKDLANAANVDISSCTNNREAVLKDLPMSYWYKMSACIVPIDHQAYDIVSDGRYLVDSSFNKVQALKFSLRRCGGDILCISPLVTEIELDKIRIPQNINTEIQATESLLTTIRLPVQHCADDGIAAYVTESYSILGDITACANNILG